MAMLKPLATHLHRSRGLCSAVEIAAAFQVILSHLQLCMKMERRMRKDWTFMMCQRWDATSGMGCFFLATNTCKITFTTNHNVWSSSLWAIRVEAGLRVSSVIQRLKSWTGPRRQVSARTQSVALRELLRLFETFNSCNASCSTRST